MRTTVEITDDQRAALLALAAKRGLRGYSAIVQRGIARLAVSVEMEGRNGAAEP